MRFHRTSIWTLTILAAAMIALPCNVQSQTTPVTQPSGTQVTSVGFYINDLFDLDLKRSTYTADFYLWMRWQGELDPSNFEFLNGTLEVKEHPYSVQAGSIKYVSYHCRATFHTAFDYSRYPLDEHTLVIEMEDGDYDSEQLKYVADHENMKALKAPILPGWTCDPPKFVVRDNAYETNFGGPSDSTGGTETYSRFYCTIRISRHSFSIYLKTFLALFISVAIAFLSFVLKPGEADPRFGVGLAAIFGAVSSEIVVASNLPDMPYLTLADKIHLFSLFVIFLTIVQSCVSLRLYRDGKQKIANRIDRISLVGFPVFYAGVILLLTFVF